MGLVKACRGYLLCAYADPDVDIGMLKRKVRVARLCFGPALAVHTWARRATRGRVAHVLLTCGT